MTVRRLIDIGLVIIFALGTVIVLDFYNQYSKRNDLEKQMSKNARVIISCDHSQLTENKTGEPRYIKCQNIIQAIPVK